MWPRSKPEAGVVVVLHAVPAVRQRGVGQNLPRWRGASPNEAASSLQLTQFATFLERL